MSKKLQAIALIVFYLFLFWFAYQVILKLTGHSPTVETILMTAMAMLISFLLVATLKLGEFMGETRAFMKNTKESFALMKSDFSSLKSDFASLKSEFGQMKSDILLLKSDSAVMKGNMSLMKSDISFMKVNLVNLSKKS